MVDRLIEQRAAVSHVLTTSVFDVDNLTPGEWTTVIKLMSTLRPLVNITQELSHTSYPLLSTIIPTITGVCHALRTSTEGVDALRDVLLQLLSETFADVFSDDELCAATVVGLLSYCFYLHCSLSVKHVQDSYSTGIGIVVFNVQLNTL